MCYIQPLFASFLVLVMFVYGLYMLLLLTDVGVIAVHPFPVMCVVVLALVYRRGSLRGYIIKNKEAKERYEKACNIAGLYHLRFKVSKRPGVKAYHGIEENDAVIQYFN